MACEPSKYGAGIDLSPFRQVFFEEAGENLDRIERQLLELDIEAADDEQLNAIFRCAHSVKGGAATFGFSDMAGSTHQMETLLDRLRRRETMPSAAMVDVLLSCADALRTQLARHQRAGGNAVDGTGLRPAIGELRKGAATAEASTLRVSTEKVDRVIDLVDALVAKQGLLAQRGNGANAGLAELARQTRDLQILVMSIRMDPVSTAFGRFPRMLRDLATRLGKKVELVTLGEATELDKTLLEKITEPLTQLVRNSCDHGIEAPAERMAQGKAEHGTITLTASKQGGRVLIEVRDDGRGLSREKLLAKARQRGIDAPDCLPNAAVWRLVFVPGLSTAEVATDVSGRGVGMDVVKKNITALGGTVEIDSTAGRGMHVSMRLPLKSASSAWR